ncbi:MAG: ABC transporter permease [Eubacteriales bacterium]|nr:ABC transporter permease [Eubacteriales bacterium]MDD3074456.1 ABC transporter permease [Eubacteriales bacterium]MDD4768734.1 ABC transporter permease [Eubacteriales bacterium]
MTELILPAMAETIYMVVLSLFFSAAIGVPLGLLLVVTGQGHLLPKASLNLILTAVINISRSVPFIIMMVAVVPFTRLMVGSTIGTTAAIVPLSLSAIPFVARVTESAIREVDPGLIEAALSMGASPGQVVRRVLISEALPGLVRGLTLTAINLIGYSTMAGVLGGGGLGNLAIRFGYQRRETAILVATIIALIVLVQLVQGLGNKLVAKLSR